MDNIKKVFSMTTAIVFVVAFLLGYGTSARIVNRDRTSDAAQKTAQSDVAIVSSLADISAAGMAMSTANAITADDQPAGTAVAVKVTAEKEAWAVVHEDAGGKPGNILGAQMFPAGTHLGTITLLRETAAGKKYYAMLHADDGDRAFDYGADQPLMNEAEEPIMTAFTATIAPAQ